MSIWEAIILGIVQGLTEFLPISSTAHLLAVRKWLGHAHPEDAFTVVIQLGTLVAVFAYFRGDVWRLLRGVAGDLIARRIASNDDSRQAWLIACGTVPAVLVGFLFKKQLKAWFFNLPSVAIVATLFALLMGFSEWWASRRVGQQPERNESQLGLVTALWIGLWQACALMPGASRSGTTITGGRLAQLSRPAAARFSFLLSLPVILAAGCKELFDELRKLRLNIGPGEAPSLFASREDAAALVVGTVVAAVVGYLSIAWLMRYLRQRSTYGFVAYRLLLGAVLGILLATGLLK
jgi:undecaprenyl-diphosphatase